MMSGFGIIMMILAVLLVLSLIYVLIDSTTKVRQIDSNRALEILEERFKNDEISEKEYLAKKETLLKRLK